MHKTKKILQVKVLVIEHSMHSTIKPGDCYNFKEGKNHEWQGSHIVVNELKKVDSTLKRQATIRCNITYNH